MKKFKISIADFLPENGKHEVGTDKNGEKVCLGDLVKYNEENWFVGYRYGDVALKQVGMMGLIVPKDLSVVEKLNTIASGADWLIIATTDDPLYPDVKHMFAS